MSSFSGKKSRSKNDPKSKKKKSKSEKSKTPTSATPFMPKTFTFLWRIQHVVPKDVELRYVCNVHDGKNDWSKYWHPPNKRKEFSDPEDACIYRWNRNTCDLYEGSSKGLKEYQTASVFVQARQDNFMAVALDCTKEDVRKSEHGWSQLGFMHQDSGLSYLDYGYKHPGAPEALRSPADGASWMPEVLPKTYEPPQYGPEGDIPYDNKTRGLCGKLSLILALAAFSCDHRTAARVVSNSFRLRHWVSNEQEIGAGRWDRRGVIVTIYLNPDNKHITKDHLEAFENGDWGPILAVDTEDEEGWSEEESYDDYSDTEQGYETGPSGHGDRGVYHDDTVPRSYARNQFYPSTAPRNVPRNSRQPEHYPADEEDEEMEGVYDDEY